MNVLYDLSVAGLGYTNPKARTGVFRVVETLFLELAKQSEVKLNTIALNAQSSLWNAASTQLYLQKCQPQLQHLFQPFYSSRLHLDPFYHLSVEGQRSLIHVSFRYNPLLYKAAIASQIPTRLVAKFDQKLCLDSKAFDLYHSPFFPLPNPKVLGGIPRILTIYDMIPVLNPQLFTAKIHKTFIATLNSINCDRDWIICISEHTKQDFCNYTGMSSDRVFVTPLAAANHFYPVSDSQIISSKLQRYDIPSRPYLLSLATLEPRKNLSFLIRCFGKLINEDPTLDLQLVLVGVSGWKNTDIFQAAQQNPQLQSRIIFTGYLPDVDLSAIYSGATAFVYPSLYEGFGLPPLEAMQCGTPVITSNTSSLPEVVGDAGILIDPKQEDELCHAILQVVQNSELRADLALRSLERARQFSWAKCAAETVEVYKIAAYS